MKIIYVFGTQKSHRDTESGNREVWSANLDAEVLISAEEDSPLREAIFRKGRIFTAHALLAADMLEVSVPELVQLLLGVNDNNWCSYDHIETAARLIVLVARQEGANPRDIIDTIRQQVDQNPQQHRYLIDLFTTRGDQSFEWILTQHGF